ncbi:ABC transporter permease [Mesorhizobium caraganae]|uniref:ABC transporter permease n=1 Tax=Mesorhizobium caraganae TaxID=483206 RepID=UPI00193A63FE|nr:ABC transporter permease [Mesorhizobium caraganae]MBM2713581.1 ABC transporter permease [Mesorhizobium caraganae]
MVNSVLDPVSQRYSFIGSSLATVVYVFLLAPVAVTIPMAFGPTNALEFPPSTYSLDLFRILFTSDSWLLPIYTSLKVAVFSTAAALFVGVPSAYWISRHEFLGKLFILGTLLSPLVIPTIVSGLGIYFYFSYIGIGGTTLSLVLGHLMVTLPFVMLMIIAGVQKLDRNLEFGAELMGASPIHMFLTVVLPQLVPSLISAAFFAFLLSFDEVIISWFLAGSDTVTLPVKMYNDLSWEVSPVIAAVSALLTALSVLACIVTIGLRKSTGEDVS